MPEKLGTVLFLTIDFPPHPGGMSRHCLDAAIALAKQGYHVAVITADSTRQPVPLYEGIEVIRIQGLDYGKLFDDYRGSVWRYVREGTRYCRRHRVRFCFANTWTIAGVAAMFIRFFCCVPYAVFAHGLDVQSGSCHPKAACLMRRVFNFSRTVVANSLFTRELVSAHVPAGKAVMVHPAVEDNRLKSGSAVDPRLSGKRFMLTVARLVESKGIDTAIRGFAEAVKKCGDVYYAIVGSGAQEKALKDLARDCGVADRVVFAGGISDEGLGAYYASCSFFIMVSREVPQRQEVEGFGIVFLEAALFSRPAVASRCGGIPEAVVDGQTALLVNSDDVPATAEAAARFFNDKEFAVRLGAQARTRALDEFSLEKFGSRLAGLIDCGKEG